MDLEDPEPSPPQQTVKLHLRPLHRTGKREHLQVEHVLQPLALFVQDRISDVQAATLGFCRYDVTNRFEDPKAIFVDPVVDDETHEEDFFVDLRAEEVVRHERDPRHAFWRVFLPELRVHMIKTKTRGVGDEREKKRGEAE